jgi:3-carboxy-cis,cis-muconate cycloisomerase
MAGLSLFDQIFAGADVAEVFSDRAHVQGLLDFEAALARAEARVGVIPQKAARAIVRECDASLYDLYELGADAREAGNTLIPLQAALTARVRGKDKSAAGFVHWGATSQDALDTGLVLQMRAALNLMETDLRKCETALAALARKHRATPMVGRTWMQQALPVTFGLKAAGWLDALMRHRARLAELRPRVLVLQFGGAAGTLASLGGKAPAVARALARELKLPLPTMPWHGARDRVVEAGQFCAGLTGTLAKMARDISLLAQTEVGEVAEPAAPGRGGSSAMPQKRNPVSCAAILANGARVSQLAATLAGAMAQENERGLGGWQAEWATLPEIFCLSAGALEHALVLARGLEVFPDRMAQNLAASGGLVMSESVKMRLAKKIGQGPAHAAVARAVRAAVKSGRPLGEALLADREISGALSARDINAALKPGAYLGSATAFVDRVLAARKKR